MDVFNLSIEHGLHVGVILFCKQKTLPDALSRWRQSQFEVSPMGIYPNGVKIHKS